MSKDSLLDLLRDILGELKKLQDERAEDYLHSIIISYEKVIDMLVMDEFPENLIKSSPREYLEIYSDYENPLLDKMDFAQKQLSLFIGGQP
ncbi:hypothetical protein [Pseudomonas sp. NPDC086251]|jgi:hypothetical protein|uniref:hypothetical protein n=1 Tax=Pseudomonas sp. NPDC086251 TaxID=3364431 RepID=UPI0038325F02